MRILEFKTWLEDYYDKQGFWAGEGGGASGIMLIAEDTKRICLAFRSKHVHIGNCFGTLGGAIQKGMTPAQSAEEELKEETDYAGPVKLVPAYVFQKGSFKYYNFLGIIPKEVEIKTTNWENDYMKWFGYDELKEYKNEFHPGLIALLQNSKDLIKSYL